MPAEKSRNSLPSTSSTITPRPRLATSGYERVYEGEISRASATSTRRALGPGNFVLILGPAEARIAAEVICNSPNHQENPPKRVAVKLQLVVPVERPQCQKQKNYCN